MHIKRLTAFIISCLLIACMALTFVGCGGTAEPTACTEHTDANGDGICDTEGCGATVEKNPEVEAGTFNENGELLLFKSGVPTFKFVIGGDVTAQTAQVKELAETIAKYTKDKVEPAVETADGEVKAVEILIGTVTNRGDEYKINKYDYGMSGYTIQQIGTKVVIVAGSEKSISTALKYFRETVLGIKKSSPQFEDFTMSKEKNYEFKQNNYSLKEITIDKTSIKEYVISYADSDSYAKNTATELQTKLYEKCGIRLEVLSARAAAGMKQISFTTLLNDGEGGGFYVNVDADKNLTFECEFADKSTELMLEFFDKNIFNQKLSYNIKSDFSYTPNLRDIYYKDYGAKGDGVADDFFALKAAHDEANKYLLNVHADPDAIYRIGNENKTQTITVQTNTYWHGCKFIFDDENVLYTDKDARETSIFSIAPNNNNKEYRSTKVPFKTLEAGATNVGWAPGVKLLILVENSGVKHYIRSGHNANSGDNQQEILLIDENGNIDPSTPVQWTYEKITKVTVAYIDADKPIEIIGEEFDENGNVIRKTEITTWHNNGPCAYWYYQRNIAITRSNVTITGLKHGFDNFVAPSKGGNGSPYSGFIRVNFANNISIDNFTFHSPPAYDDSETDSSLRPSGSPTPTNGSMGTYEMGARHGCNVTWSNCDQTDFFYYLPTDGDRLGKVHANGNMGTNHCRNLVFDNVWNCSFDAHSGLYNATIKDSTLEHVNFIGAGLIKYENVTVYAQKKHAVNLRTDYGSTWRGDIEIDGLIMKTLKSSKVDTLSLIGAEYTNWYYGYTVYLPQNITIRNLVTAEYSFTIDNGVRNEKIETYNTHKFTLYKNLNSPDVDYSASTVNGEENKNQMVATKRIDYYTTYTGKYAELGITAELNFIPPSGPFYAKTQYYKNGELQ